MKHRIIGGHHSELTYSQASCPEIPICSERFEIASNIIVSAFYQLWCSFHCFKFIQSLHFMVSSALAFSS